MNLSTAAAIALCSAASAATASAYSFSSKGSKASSKATKSKASKSGSMSMSMLNCRSEEGLIYDTGTEFLEVDVEGLVSGGTFNYFSYSGASNPLDGTCFDGDEIGIMRFNADNNDAPDGTISECEYQACLEEDCAPDCCCENIILIEVTD